MKICKYCNETEIPNWADCCLSCGNMDRPQKARLEAERGKKQRPAQNSIAAVVSRWGRWPALSIQQPWAWLILHAGKNVENRTRYTDYRGRFYIHTGQKFDQDGYNHILEMRSIYLSPRMIFPEPQQFLKGGVVGIVELVDCVQKAESKWADHWPDTWNLILENAQEIDFLPLRGKLGFFNLNG